MNPFAFGKTSRHQISLAKELKAVDRQERALRRGAFREPKYDLLGLLEDRVPANLRQNLQKAFCTAFRLIFEKGTGVIEKSYDRKGLEKDHQVQIDTFQAKGSRGALKKARKQTQLGKLGSMAVTTAEGVGLGLLGIGMPDIVLFVGMLLRGVYEVALRYGFGYDSVGERIFMLQLMEAAMSRREDWERLNGQIDLLLLENAAIAEEPEVLQKQIQQTADTFAVDMVVLKFVQGLPLVGVLGGMGNPVYYNRVMKYVELKYRKRWLLELQRQRAPFCAQ